MTTMDVVQITYMAWVTFTMGLGRQGKILERVVITPLGKKKVNSSCIIKVLQLFKIKDLYGFQANFQFQTYYYLQLLMVNSMSIILATGSEGMKAISCSSSTKT